MGPIDIGSPAITAENVRELFPDVEALSVVSPASCGVSAAESGDFEGYDEEQVRMMDEVCIVLDVDDEPIGRVSKRDFYIAHFPRADKKVTFPMMWTNTCCSHPLDIPDERGTDFGSAILGVKRAARRKLGQELGIRPEQVPLEDFQFLTRVHYKAPSDGKWVDYILFIQADVDLAVNRNEVQDVRWVSPEDLRNMFATPGLQYTPWFKLICDSLLFKCNYRGPLPVLDSCLLLV
ncbi:NUDIX hydrolase domain-like protein [Aspergillus pseudotamarii]|uniref:isopentenyl-diphosphate Delta-isomerase n=1 Tax=Aspergillus pseudotamarii TaxID=132259 RepID=A0A5N6SQH7_ASPPS|nr:NUDIX hydrolase domain-like protein [Aspergillus pseudotamarii]KAE8136089.1 NUDIX hydrolase domain-like protein [Aspergillus pseudotamarii]